MTRVFLEKTKSRDDRGLEILLLGNEGPADSVVFDIVPDELIGVEFGAVRRQKEQTQPVRDRFKIRLDLFGSMRGMAINNQENLPTTAMEQAFEKHEEERGPHRFFCHQEPEFPFGRNRRDHVESKPLAGGSDDRSLSLDRPSRSRMKIRAHPRLVFKEDLSSFSLGQGADPGILFLQPLFHQGRILLQGLNQRSLTSQPQLSEQASDRGEGEADPIFFPDQRPDHSSGPEGEGEFQLQRIFGGDSFINPLDLASRKLLGSSRHLAGLQGVPSSGPIGCEPLVNATPGESQGLDDCLGAFPILNLLNGPDADSFTSFMGDLATVESCGLGLGCVHATPYHKATIVYSDL